MKYKQEILMLNNTVYQMYLSDIHRTSHTNIKEFSTVYTAFFQNWTHIRMEILENQNNICSIWQKKEQSKLAAGMIQLIVIKPHIIKPTEEWVNEIADPDMIPYSHSYNVHWEKEVLSSINMRKSAKYHP